MGYGLEIKAWVRSWTGEDSTRATLFRQLQAGQIEREAGVSRMRDKAIPPRVAGLVRTVAATQLIVQRPLRMRRAGERATPAAPQMIGERKAVQAADTAAPRR